MLRRLLAGLVPPTRLERDLALQSALTWGAPGWAVIAAIGVTAAVVPHPAARAAQRHLARHAEPSPSPSTSLGLSP